MCEYANVNILVNLTLILFIETNNKYEYEVSSSTSKRYKLLLTEELNFVATVYNNISRTLLSYKYLIMLYICFSRKSVSPPPCRRYTYKYSDNFRILSYYCHTRVI